MTNNDTLLRLTDVMEITGLGHTNIYQRIAAGTFPKQVKIGARTARWVESEVREWVRSQVEARDLETEAA